MHKGLTYSKGQRAWAVAPSLSGEILETGKKNKSGDVSRHASSTAEIELRTKKKILARVCTQRRNVRVHSCACVSVCARVLMGLLGFCVVAPLSSATRIVQLTRSRAREQVMLAFRKIRSCVRVCLARMELPHKDGLAQRTQTQTKRRARTHFAAHCLP